MAIPNDILITTMVKAWTPHVSVNGTTIEVTGLPTFSLGYDQPRNTCTLPTLVYPDIAADADVIVTLTLNGTWSQQVFTGRIDSRPITDVPLSYRMALVDKLSHLQAATKQPITWSNASFATAVLSVLTQADVHAAVVGIYDPGGDFALGSVDPIVIAAGTSLSSLLDQLMAYGGAQLFVNALGQIEVIEYPGWPATSSDVVYAYGAAIGTEFGFYSASRTVVGIQQHVTKYTAKGYRLSTGRIADATFTMSGATGQTVVETFTFLQTDACAKKIAEREIVKQNRSATEVDISAPLNPNLRPGQTVMFRDTRLGYPTNTASLVIGVQVSGAEMTLTLSVGARPAAGSYSLIPPPNPSFTMKYEIQPVTLAGLFAPMTVVECVNTSTDPSGFTLVAATWYASCDGTIPPDPEEYAQDMTVNPPEQPIFVFPTLDAAVITLQVESSSGEIAEITLPVTAPTSEAFTRCLSVAADGSGWRLLTSSSGWTGDTSGGTCTAVPEINDHGPLLAGFANGEVYRSHYFSVTPELLVTFPSAVQYIFVNEGNPLEILVASEAAVYRSSDGGVGWSPVASFPDLVMYCESSPSNPNEIRVCAAGSLYISYDGTTFTPLVTGPVGSFAMRVASAPWGHLVAFAGTLSVSDAVRFEEGYSVDWSAVPMEHRPANLSAATPLLSEPGFLVASGGAAGLIRDGLYQQLAYLAHNGSAPAKIYKLLQGASGFTATYLTTVADGGVYKIATGAGRAFAIDPDVSTAHRVGYGVPTSPALPPELVVLPYNTTGAADMIWHYHTGVGWMSHGLPVAGGMWRGIAISPMNAREWLIWDNYSLYMTTNAGESWIEVMIPRPPRTWATATGLLSVTYTSMTAGTWMAALAGNVEIGGSSGDPLQSQLVLGTGTTITMQALWGRVSTTPPGYVLKDDTMVFPVTSLTMGAFGEVWGYTIAPGRLYATGGLPEGTHQAWINPTTLDLTLVDPTPFVPASPSYAEDRAGWAVTSSGTIGKTLNYKSEVATSVISGGMSVVEVDVGVFIGGRRGIAIIDGIATPTPTLRVVAGNNTAIVGRVVAGSLRRGAAALEITADAEGKRRIYAHNGMQWTNIALPDALTGQTVCETIGLVEL